MAERCFHSLGMDMISTIQGNHIVTVTGQDKVENSEKRCSTRATALGSVVSENLEHRGHQEVWVQSTESQIWPAIG